MPETFSFQQPQHARMHDVLLRLGRAAIRSQKITDHEAANDAQHEALREIEALVTEALAARFEWADLCAPLRRSSIHSVAGGEPERYLIKIGCPDLGAMQTVRDGLVYLRENASHVQPSEEPQHLATESDQPYGSVRLEHDLVRLNELKLARLTSQLEIAQDALVKIDRGRRSLKDIAAQALLDIALVPAQWLEFAAAPEAKARSEEAPSAPEISHACADVLTERRRQIKAEGWTPEHDDSHTLGELGLAAALYALPYDARVGGEALIEQAAHIQLDMALEIACGWTIKPEADPRKRLVKAGALILAEIERLDRTSLAAREVANG